MAQIDTEFWESELSDIDTDLANPKGLDTRPHHTENRLTYLELLQEHEGKTFNQLAYEYEVEGVGKIPINEQFFPFFNSLKAFSENVCALQIENDTLEIRSIDGTTYGIVTIKISTATIEIAILSETRYKNPRAFYIQMTDTSNIFRLTGEGTARKRIQKSLKVSSNIDLENPTLVVYNLLAIVNKWLAKTDI